MPLSEQSREIVRAAAHNQQSSSADTLELLDMLDDAEGDLADLRSAHAALLLRQQAFLDAARFSVTKDAGGFSLDFVAAYVFDNEPLPDMAEPWDRMLYDALRALADAAAAEPRDEECE